MPGNSTTPDLEEKTRQLVEAGDRHDFDAIFVIFSTEAVSDRSPVGQEVIEGDFVGGR
jgi:hypothetical protein